MFAAPHTRQTGCYVGTLRQRLPQRTVTAHSACCPPDRDWNGNQLRGRRGETLALPSNAAEPSSVMLIIVLRLVHHCNRNICNSYLRHIAWLAQELKSCCVERPWVSRGIEADLSRLRWSRRNRDVTQCTTSTQRIVSAAHGPGTAWKRESSCALLSLVSPSQPREIWLPPTLAVASVKRMCNQKQAVSHGCIAWPSRNAPSCSHDSYGEQQPCLSQPQCSVILTRSFATSSSTVTSNAMHCRSFSCSNSA
jgi:hypothetical protein